jgi:antitoxin component of MazEF toxin-antitoxin module
MSIVVTSKENTAIISVPIDELTDLGLSIGDEIELSKNENDEIVLRPKQTDRKARILSATREIIDERKSALIELGKGHE